MNVSISRQLAWKIEITSEKFELELSIDILGKEFSIEFIPLDSGDIEDVENFDLESCSNQSDVESCPFLRFLFASEIWLDVVGSLGNVIITLFHIITLVYNIF